MSFSSASRSSAFLFSSANSSSGIAVPSVASFDILLGLVPLSWLTAPVTPPKIVPPTIPAAHELMYAERFVSSKSASLNASPKSL